MEDRKSLLFLAYFNCRTIPVKVQEDIRIIFYSFFRNCGIHENLSVNIYISELKEAEVVHSPYLKDPIEDTELKLSPNDLISKIFWADQASSQLPSESKSEDRIRAKRKVAIEGTDVWVTEIAENGDNIQTLNLISDSALGMYSFLDIVND